VRSSRPAWRSASAGPAATIPSCPAAAMSGRPRTGAATRIWPASACSSVNVRTVAWFAEWVRLTSKQPANRHLPARRDSTGTAQPRTNSTSARVKPPMGEADPLLNGWRTGFSLLSSDSPSASSSAGGGGRCSSRPSRPALRGCRPEIELAAAIERRLHAHSRAALIGLLRIGNASGDRLLERLELVVGHKAAGDHAVS
jgi:hypothetical protein